MKALVMAGGRSTRFGGGEKPMALLRGKPLIGWVVDALERGHAGPVAVAVSARTPLTARWARTRGLRVVETPGRGFVEDASLAARKVGLPLLVAAGDLPLLPPEVVREAVRRHGETHRPLSAWVPAPWEGPLVRDGLAPAGLNLWAAGREEQWVVWSPGLRANVNALEELLQLRAACAPRRSENGRNPEESS